MLSRIREWCKFIGHQDQKLLQQKAGEWGTPRDMDQWSRYLTVDVLGELCFGRSFGIMETHDMTIPSLLMDVGKLYQMVYMRPLC